ncbi:MAG TPA: prenyltransferase/squalene oxidase repeat-containing protein [Bryobacteraceae bacterium]
MPIPKLVQQQNADGGWPYRRGGSWTEPTVYAVLALADSPAAERGLQWICAAQRDDGGWQARPGVGESCWVTSLAALLPAERLGVERHQRATAWLSATTGMESTTLYRVRQWLMGSQTSPELSAPGWPWVTGSAAWVSPTSLAILALDRENRLHPAPGLASRIAEGRRFLINRMCKGGGWNHGAARSWGYESDAYPETTGMALAALRGIHGRETEQSLELAVRFLEQCRSADALNWLRLGLAAHGRMPEGYSPPPSIAYRTVPEVATSVLADGAVAGKSVFWI